MTVDTTGAAGTTAAPSTEPAPGSQFESRASEIQSARDNGAQPGTARKRGRPKGAKTRDRGPAAPEPTAVDAKPVPTEADVRACVTLGLTVWGMAGRFVGLTPLGMIYDDGGKLVMDESRALGEAMAPVYVKHIGKVGPWVEEITLLLTVASLVASHLPAGEHLVEVVPGQETNPDGAAKTPRGGFFSRS